MALPDKISSEKEWAKEGQGESNDPSGLVTHLLPVPMAGEGISDHSPQKSPKPMLGFFALIKSF